MKRLTPLLTLLAGTGMAAVLLTMSAQAATPKPPPNPDVQAAASAAPPGTPEPGAEGLDADQPDAAPPAAPTAPAAQPADTPSATAPAKQTANWTGRLDNGATIAITAQDGKAVAYVCDGRKLEIWLRGTAADGKLNLTGPDDATLTGTFGSGKAAGELVVGDRTWTFTAKAVAKPAPVLYRASAQVRNAGVDGGWIVLPDGTQIGIVTWNGTPVPAPPLDLAFNATLVNGVSITADPVAPATGTGE